MRWRTVDYLAQEPASHRRGVVDRGFWWDEVPRLILLCRLLGHKPVADGVPHQSDVATDLARTSLWVACGRCGLRPDPQGRLDSRRWAVGQRYDGPFAAPDTALSTTGACSPPGPWPRRPQGSLGGQLVVGRGFGILGADVKIGNQGSDQVLAASIKLGNLASLYLHSDEHGQWLQRLLNPTGFESRVIKLAIGQGQLRWRLWTKRDHCGPSDLPWWRHFTVRIDPREILLGPKRHSFVDVGDPVAATVRMPHGDDYAVQLQLQKVRTGRRRGRKTESWSVDWGTDAGIPVKTGGRGRIFGASVTVADATVAARMWSVEAAAAIALQMTKHRARHGFSLLQSVS